MRQNLQTNSAKDKRLLVLLVFGLVLIVTRSWTLVPNRPLPNQSWGWLELPGRENGLQRVPLAEDGHHALFVPGSNRKPELLSLELQTLLRRHRGVALLGDGSASTRITPRLARLLGLPFPVNRATVDELTLLPGIGPKLAATIVAYREDHGRIAGAKDFRAVSGIGERLTARIAPQLTFE
ncbi:MAG: ComEA family DNA-binding protein [Desulfobulbaceae bacterium]